MFNYDDNKLINFINNYVNYFNIETIKTPLKIIFIDFINFYDDNFELNVDYINLIGSNYHIVYTNKMIKKNYLHNI